MNGIPVAGSATNDWKSANAAPVHGRFARTVAGSSPRTNRRRRRPLVGAARVGGELVPGEIVAHPVYDPQRRRAKES
jgi:hypothetical protein